MEHPTWFVGDRNPVIEDTVAINGVPVDISAKTVTFKMRAVGTDTLKVNQPVTTKQVDGDWTYGWGATDLDTAGQYLVWVTVDMGGGALQTVNEDTITVAEHAPQTNAYLELEEAKSTLELDTSYADADLVRVIVAASRTVDEITGTRFYTTVADEVRYYSPVATNVLFIDDLNDLTEVATDDAGGTGYGTVWVENADFSLFPFNAALDGEPWHQLRVLGNTSNFFRCSPRSVRVTGKFGWTAVPQGVKAATGIISTQFLVQSRSAPLGVISAFDGTAVRMSTVGPRVMDMLAPYVRRPLIA